MSWMARETSEGSSRCFYEHFGGMPFENLDLLNL